MFETFVARGDVELVGTVQRTSVGARAALGLRRRESIGADDSDAGDGGDEQITRRPSANCGGSHVIVLRDAPGNGAGAFT
jgi:hypothetical protein